MPNYRFTSDVDRVYPQRPISVQPGDVAAWDEAPDGWWEPTDQPVTRDSDNLPQPEPAAGDEQAEAETAAPLPRRVAAPK